MTSDQLIFGAFPYAALLLAITVTIIRYTSRRFSFSSLSSQFLENKKLFWGSVSWHYGIIILFLGHIIAFLIPSSVLAWNGVPWRLYVLEGVALACGFLVLWGLGVLLFRRLTDPRVKKVTSVMDIILLLVLFLQVATGVSTAVYYRWGSSWFAGSLSPYLWSLVEFSPNVALVENLPFWFKVHAANAFVLVAIFPFTRLVHLLSIPIAWVTRPHQVVIWNRRPGE